MKHIETEVVHTSNGHAIIGIPIRDEGAFKYFIAQDRLMCTNHINEELKSVDLLTLMHAMKGDDLLNIKFEEI